MTDTIANFKGGGSKNISLRLKSSLQWTHKWKNPSFKPNEYCKMEKKSNDYQLICRTPDNSKTSWTKDVPKSYVVIPEQGVQETV